MFSQSEIFLMPFIVAYFVSLECVFGGCIGSGALYGASGPCARYPPEFGLMPHFLKIVVEFMASRPVGVFVLEEH